MRLWRRSATPNLVESLRRQVVLERASRQNAGSGKAALIAHYATTARASRSVNALVRSLLEHDYSVTLVSSSPVRSALDFDPYAAGGLTVLRKPNLGYDFGSWAVGLAMTKGISGQDTVLLANDSMVGPFWDLAAILTALETSSADVFALTDSDQFSYHPQSYFVGYRRGVLAEPALKRFWTGVEHHDDKNTVIGRGELAQGRLLRASGFSVTAYVGSRRVVEPGVNPVIHGWRRLLELGVPFVKRQLLTEPWVAGDAHEIPAYLKGHHDVDVKEWL
ncbi:MAG: rhamnan synthesis F family protein [Candidatus Phosphoribacter sp.]|nr:hypothetical protein [Actinomycetales bacterium]